MEGWTGGEREGMRGWRDGRMSNKQQMKLLVSALSFLANVGSECIRLERDTLEARGPKYSQEKMTAEASQRQSICSAKQK